MQVKTGARRMCEVKLYKCWYIVIYWCTYKVMDWKWFGMSLLSERIQF